MNFKGYKVQVELLMAKFVAPNKKRRIYYLF